MQAARHGRNADGHGGVVAVAGIHRADGVKDGEAVFDDLFHIPLLHHREVAVTLQLFHQAVVFLRKGFDDMFDLSHGAAALVFLGVGKQLGIVIDEHGKDIRTGIEVFPGVEFEVVVIHQRDDGQRFLGGGGVHEKDGIVPLPDDDIAALRRALGQPVQPGDQLRDVAAEQFLPGKDRLLGGRIAPDDLAVLADDHRGHGQAEDRVAHDMLQRILQLAEAPAVVPGDQVHPDDAADGKHAPDDDTDIKHGHIKARRDGGHNAAGRNEDRKDRTVLIEPFQHNVPPFPVKMPFLSYSPAAYRVVLVLRYNNGILHYNTPF